MRGYRYTARLLKALAHPVRLAILEVLRQDGESCVCHLEHALCQRQAYISQQLARLRAAGLVVDRRAGLNVYYALSDEDVGHMIEDVQTATQTRAASEGHDLVFKLIDPDRTEGCPCPKCLNAAQLSSELKLEQGR